ncbi:hypothetical protein PV325_009471, partial [Microctonus aethiopoides]
CHKCYKYGHIKKYCKKANKRCVICGEDAHGICTKNLRCINCGGAHKSNFRGCPEYEKNANIKRVSAEKGISIYEAKLIMRDHTQQYRNPWISNKDWPILRQENGPNNENTNNVMRNDNIRQSYPSKYSQIAYRKPDVSTPDRRDERNQYNEQSTSKGKPIQNRGRIYHQVNKFPTEQGRKENAVIEEERIKAMENIIENMDEITTDEDNMIKQLQKMIEIAEKKIAEIINKRLRQKDSSYDDYPMTVKRIDNQIYH